MQPFGPPVPSTSSSPERHDLAENASMLALQLDDPPIVPPTSEDPLDNIEPSRAGEQGLCMTVTGIASFLWVGCIVNVAES